MYILSKNVIFTFLEYILYFDVSFDKDKEPVKLEENWFVFTFYWAINKQQIAKLIL